jgi:hypothetical protein
MNRTSLITLVALFSAALAVGAEDRSPFPSRFSEEMEKRGISSVFTSMIVSNTDGAFLPKEYQLATKTGCLIAVVDDEPRWQIRLLKPGVRQFVLCRSIAAVRLKDAIVKLGYKSYETPSDTHRMYLAPSGLFGRGFAPDLYYEDSYAERVLNYHDEWLLNKSDN